MPLALILIVLFLIIVLGIWITSSLVGLIVTLFVAGLIGWLADQIVPGKLPYGWLGAIVAGLVGSWVGGLLLGGFGPDIGGIAIIPALLGAIILAFVARLLFNAEGGRRF